MTEIRKIDIVKAILSKLVFSVLVTCLIFAILYYFSYTFKSIIVNAVLLWVVNFLLSFSLQATALTFWDSGDLTWNISTDYLKEQEVAFLKAHPKLAVYNAAVLLVNMMIKIIIFIYLVVGLYLAE
jgi:hypothetical protein